MKRIFLACFLLTATCAATFQQAAAQTITVTASDFTTKVNLLDAQIAAGNMTAAQATWSNLNDLMKAELGVTKANIMHATTSTEKTAAATANRNQVSLYRAIWGLKADLATNRSAIHTQLGLFAATI